MGESRRDAPSLSLSPSFHLLYPSLSLSIADPTTRRSTRPSTRSPTPVSPPINPPFFSLDFRGIAWRFLLLMGHTGEAL